MRVFNLTAFTLLLSPLFFSCGVVLPVSSQFENASTLKKGGVEVEGQYSAYLVSAEGTVNKNFGVKIGYGLTDKFDLKLRYENLAPVMDEGDGQKTNYFSVIPKI